MTGQQHAVIIGNGVTGVSAAQRLRELQPDWKITLVSGESTHHYSRPALMYIFMGHQKYQDTKPYEDSYWREMRLDLLRDWVTGIDAETQTLTLHRTGSLSYDTLLIATGSKSNRFGWPGQDLDGVQGLWDLMDLKQLYQTIERTKRAVIVGGGLIGIELAEMIHSRGIPVTFLVRESSYWGNVLSREESAMITRHIREEHFDLRLETELEEILDDGQGRVRGVRTKSGEEISCECVGLTAGVSPNLDLPKLAGIPCGRGVLVDEGLRTQVDGIYAAGDCAEIIRPGVERNLIQQVWYTGKAQGRIAGENMAGGAASYDPGIWYNSAKFLHLEYQTYGLIIPGVNDQHSLWWEHADGKHGMRIVHDGEGQVTGINVMGLRYRHPVCEGWIREGRDLGYVIAHLADANFDPEFFPRFEPEITRQFQEALR